MRKPIYLLLVLVVFLVPNTSIRADGVDDDVANRLALTALSRSSQREARLAALQALTELGPKASAAIETLKTILRDGVLPADQSELKELVVFLTAQALAAIGEKARSAIPVLVEAQGKVSDPKAKKALATAVVAITLAAQAPQLPPPPSSLTIDQLLANLRPNKNVQVRRDAAKELNKRAAEIATALPKLVDATKDVDTQTAAAARQAVEQIILATQKWTQSYIQLRVADLASQDESTREQAAKDLGNLGTLAANALPFLRDRLKVEEKSGVITVINGAIKQIDPSSSKNGSSPSKNP